MWIAKNNSKSLIFKSWSSLPILKEYQYWTNLAMKKVRLDLLFKGLHTFTFWYDTSILSTGLMPIYSIRISIDIVSTT